MANIVELRDMSNDKIEEMLENNREELFNLRFQQASARLEDYSRLRLVRREIAQLETVLNNRRQAIETAVAETPELARFLSNQSWDASARYVYEDASWTVDFINEDGDDIASAVVDLNVKKPKGRKGRMSKAAPQSVQSYEISG